MDCGYDYDGAAPSAVLADEPVPMARVFLPRDVQPVA